MADLVADITYLQEQFQHEADLNSWVCLAMPAWGNVGVPTIGELFHPTAPPPEPPGKILDGSGRPVPPSKASLLEKAEYAKATRSIRFSDEHGRDRDASIEEVAKAIQLRDYLNSHNGMVDQYGPPPWVMTPRDLRRTRVTEHVTALTWEAERLLVCVLDGPNQISADIQEQIQNEIKECPLLGWMRWLRSSVSPSGPVWRIENYPKVAVTGLMQLRGVVGAKAQGTKTGESASVDSAEKTGQPANGDGAMRKRRRKAERPTKPLTLKQAEVVQLYGELKGDFAAVGERMGIKRQTAQIHYERAMKKLGKSAMPKPKTRTLPKDKRGQEAVADPHE